MNGNLVLSGGPKKRVGRVGLWDGCVVFLRFFLLRFSHLRKMMNLFGAKSTDFLIPQEFVLNLYFHEWKSIVKLLNNKDLVVIEEHK